MFFSSREKEKSGDYPPVPDSLRSETPEVDDLRPVREARADTSPHITPYLGLRSRLSQIWLNRWTILLVLVLVRVVILIAQLITNIDDAKAQALESCTKVEDIGSSMASMPHYLSRGVNELAATGIEQTVHGLVTVLDLMLEGVEGLLKFVIGFAFSITLCLIVGAIHGSLDVVKDVVDEATDTFNDLIKKVTGEIDDIADDLESGINKITKGIEDSIIGDLIPDIPDVDFSKPVDNLKDFKLNTDDFQKGLQSLNDDIPNFDDIKNATMEAISVPFDKVRALLDDNYAKYKFDRDVFPLAQKQQLTFCSDNDTIQDFFKHIYKLVHTARIVFIVVLLILAVAVIVPMAWIEIKRWRRQQKHARLIARHQYDPMDVVYIGSRPATATFGIKIASRFRGKRQVLVRWLIAYATSPPALFVLSLALAGFFSCLCQFILLKAVQKEVPEIAGQVGKFADQVVDKLEVASTAWADDANSVVKNFQDDINKDILGYVVNATDAANDTLTEFYDNMQDGLKVFDGTILQDPMKTAMGCIIGFNIESVQKGLTWVHDNAQVKLPQLDKTIFSLGAKDSVEGDSELNTFLSSPSSVTTDEVTGAVKKVTEWMHDNIIQEALVSTGLLLVWVIVALIGTMRMLVGMVTPDKGRAEGGMRYTGDSQESSWHNDSELHPQSEAYSREKTMYGGRSQGPHMGEAYQNVGSGSKF